MQPSTEPHYVLVDDLTTALDRGGELAEALIDSILRDARFFDLEGRIATLTRERDATRADNAQLYETLRQYSDDSLEWARTMAEVEQSLNHLLRQVTAAQKA